VSLFVFIVNLDWLKKSQKTLELLKDQALERIAWLCDVSRRDHYRQNWSTLSLTVGLSSCKIRI